MSHVVDDERPPIDALKQIARRVRLVSPCRTRPERIEDFVDFFESEVRGQHGVHNSL